jgi:hypothetical protein
VPRSGLVLVASIQLVASSAPLSAQTPPADLLFGGYIQSQYRQATTGDGESRDRVFFRRIIAGVEATLGDRWAGEIQVDLAPVTIGERVLLRDAYLRYNGLDHRGLIITVGNQKVPFSRSVLMRSSRRSLIERPFTGERQYGSSGRAISIRADGRTANRSLQWAAALASAHHAPDAGEIRISGIAESREDWNEGPMIAGRAEWHPRGAVPLDQGAFDISRVVFTVATGAYYWHNDGDNNPYTAGGRSSSTTLADLHNALSIEVSGAVRAPRLSLDAELHRTTGSTIDPMFTGGLYHVGHARLVKASLESGYMLLAGRLEALGAIDRLDADAYEAVIWRPTLGLNWYFLRHRLKFQFMHRETFNPLGERGRHARETLLQAHIGF